MTTNKNNTGAHMKQNSTKQTGRREAPDSSVRPANPTRRQWADAYRAARRLNEDDTYFQRAVARQLAAALSSFGGRVIAVEKPTQATA